LHQKAPNQNRLRILTQNIGRKISKSIPVTLKLLLTITALLEGATGLALATIPALVFSKLLGFTPTDPSMILMSRMGGVGLIVLAIACWVSRGGSHALTMVKVMTGYNILSIVGLVYLGYARGMNGPGLWPAVILHLVLLGWCLSALRKVQPGVS
jgi:hypothetical protein